MGMANGTTVTRNWIFFLKHIFVLFDQMTKYTQVTQFFFYILHTLSLLTKNFYLKQEYPNKLIGVPHQSTL